jgi:hypothetical protein
VKNIADTAAQISGTKIVIIETDNASSGSGCYLTVLATVFGGTYPGKTPQTAGCS